MNETLNKLIDQVSGALGTTVDNVVKLYPQLRTEYMWYKVLDGIDGILVVLFIVWFVGSALGPVLALTIFEDYTDEKTVPKLLKFLGFSLMVILGVSTLLNILKPIVAPDIVLILDLLKK